MTWNIYDTVTKKRIDYWSRMDFRPCVGDELYLDEDTQYIVKRIQISRWNTITVWV